jgi:predicted ATPase
MIKSITLQNYRSFGARQTIPLEPITVLVGPNNSGKSSFMSVGRFVQSIAGSTIESISAGEVGDTTDLVHRPPAADGSFVIEWETDLGSYGCKARPVGGRMEFIDEWLRHKDRGDAWAPATVQRGGQPEPVLSSTVLARQWDPAPFRGFLLTMRFSDSPLNSFVEVLTPLTRSREVKLSLGALRSDAPFENSPKLGSNGSNMASIVSLWRSSHPERAEALDAIMRSSIPEIRHVLARPAPEGQDYRLWFKQTDDQMFDARHVSDGVLLFTALAMHAIDAGPGSVIFLEEPEHSIHPTRLHDIVELLRRMVQEKGCQFVIATHSPVLLSEFKDEPEAILLFRRGEEGTRVTPLSEVPRLVDALRKADPGEMLANGFFNDPV